MSEAALSPTSRLNKAIAAKSGFSRRKADELIFSGRVKVNGDIEKNPARQVGIEDQLEVDNTFLCSRPLPCYLMLNKPVHCICTCADPQKRRTVLDVLPPEYRSRGLFPVGRLDYFSEGLLLLTNDGQLANRLAHPRYHQVKIYEVIVRENVPESALMQMRSGMILKEIGKILPIKVHSQKLANGTTLLRMELQQGLNRQIRRMCAQFGLTILRLTRVAQGGLQLGQLPSGACRELSSIELTQLMTESGITHSRKNVVVSS